MTESPGTLVAAARQRAETAADRPVYTLLSNGQIVDQLSFGALHAHAAAIAAQLGERTAAGDRVLILCPPGLDYIRAFFGCLFAGRIAVPAYPPRNNRHMSRLLSIIKDCQATCVLTTRELRDKLRSSIESSGELGPAAIVAVDEADVLTGRPWDGPAPQESAVAFLQYTSGSTGSPKGVMVTHRNLMMNSAMIRDAFRVADGSTYVSWLPLFHDMGLMGMLQGVFSGVHALILSPLEFLTRPFCWLDAISKHRASISGGPNFAYDLCTAKVTDEECRSLDLSSWRLAFNGAEPVQADTLRRFSQRFQASGFQSRAHYPCYGLAEATLFVSGAAEPREPVVKALSRSRLTEHEVRAADTSPGDGKHLVSCGRAFHDEVIKIVDADTRAELSEGTLGEVWIAGPHVAGGYWQNDEATAETFHAVLQGGAGQRYLRTGDLGFLEGGELYITGRLKDLIIVRGQNYYPQDIEVVAQQSHPSLVAGGAAAFAIAPPDEAGPEGTERVVLVQEVRRSARHLQLDGVIAAIKEAVAETLGVELHQVVLVLEQSIPKTSSGKIQRRRTRQLFLEGGLKQVAGASGGSASASAPAGAPTGPAGGARAALRTAPPAEARALLENTLKSIASQLLKRPFILLDSSRPLESYGMDGATARVLCARIQDEIGVELTAELPLSASLSSLAEMLLAQITGSLAERRG